MARRMSVRGARRKVGGQPDRRGDPGLHLAVGHVRHGDLDAAGDLADRDGDQLTGHGLGHAGQRLALRRLVAQVDDADPLLGGGGGRGGALVELNLVGRRRRSRGGRSGGPAGRRGGGAQHRARRGAGGGRRGGSLAQTAGGLAEEGPGVAGRRRAGRQPARGPVGFDGHGALARRNFSSERPHCPSTPGCVVPRRFPGNTGERYERKINGRPTRGQQSAIPTSAGRRGRSRRLRPAGADCCRSVWAASARTLASAVSVIAPDPSDPVGGVQGKYRPRSVGA